jgi:hypothetical protein
MIATPKLWRCLTTEWVTLEPGQAWTLWRSLGEARWSLAVSWRRRRSSHDARRPRTSPPTGSGCSTRSRRQRPG